MLPPKRPNWTPTFDEQRQIAVRERLESRDRRSDPSQTAELGREQKRRAVRGCEQATPLHHLLSVLLGRRRRRRSLKLRARQHRAHVFAHDPIRPVEESTERNRVEERVIDWLGRGHAAHPEGSSGARISQRVHGTREGPHRRPLRPSNQALFERLLAMTAAP